MGNGTVVVRRPNFSTSMDAAMDDGEAVVRRRQRRWVRQRAATAGDNSGIQKKWAGFMMRSVIEKHQNPLLKPSNPCASQ